MIVEIPARDHLVYQTGLEDLVTVKKIVDGREPIHFY
jgi:hypothetical protein